MLKETLVLVTALPFPHFGGISSYLLEEVRYFRKRGSRIVLVYPPSGMPLGRDFRYEGISLFPLKSSKTDIGKITEKVIRVFLLKKLMRQEKATTIHAHDFLSALISALAGYGKKTILHNHGVLSKDKLETAWSCRSSARMAVRILLVYLTEVLLETLAFNLVRGIICINEDVKQDTMRRSFSRSKTFVLLNGVDVTRFRPRPGKRKEQRRNLGISDDAIVCMYLGRMVPPHGPFTLCRAIPIINEKTDKAVFLFAGEGAEKDRIREYVKRKGLSNVFFPSVVYAEDIYPVAEMFLDYLSCMFKGHGISILEAMASGVAVITGRDEIKTKAFEEGREILFVQKDDSEDVAEKIISLIRDPKKRKELSLWGRRRVLASYSIDMHMQTLERILLA